MKNYLEGLREDQGKQKLRENLNIDLGIHFSKSSNIPRYDRLIRNDENQVIDSGDQGLYYS